MNAKELTSAIACAKRFLQEAEKCHPSQRIPNYIEPGAQAAATKRASMDLTKALAKLRHTR